MLLGCLIVSQFLAISRGEDLKILSLKIVFPEHVESDWIKFCENKYDKQDSKRSDFRKIIITKSIKDAYTRIGTTIYHLFSLFKFIYSDMFFDSNL